ncbi:MAG: porin [Pseudomonadota bacterium]
MKNVLFASTALVAVAAAGSAFADGHEGSGGVTIGVSADIAAIYVDQSVTTSATTAGTTTKATSDDSGFFFGEDFDVDIGASTTTDNGLTLKANASGENAGDHNFVISGAFGSVELGDNDGAKDAGMIGIAPGGIVESSTNVPTDPETGLGIGGDVVDLDQADGDLLGYGILYSSPDLGGGQVFLSYGTETQNGEDQVSAGAQFGFGPASVGAGVAVSGDDIKYGVSGKVAAGPVTLIAAVDAGEVSNTDVLIVEASAAFDTGSGTIGIQASSDLEAEGDNFGVGAWYTLPIGGGANFNLGAEYVIGTAVTNDAATNTTTEVETESTRVGTSISVSF